MTAPAPTPDAPIHNLEGNAAPAERRWMLISLGLLTAFLLYSVWTVQRLTAHGKLASASAVDHGPLPEAVQKQVLELVAPHLEHAQLLELHTGRVREFRITGTPRELLSQEFYGAFRPLVVTRLMPLLRPYGEIISFEIKSLDLPPARLREIPEAGATDSKKES